MPIQNFRPIPTITVANDYWENKKWRFNIPAITTGTGATPEPIVVTVSGIGAVTLVNAIDDGLVSCILKGDTEQLPETYLDTVTLSGGCEQRNLPSGFTQVEYLEVETDGIYFLTGINATVDTDIGITASGVTSSSAQLLVAECVSGSDYFRIAKASASQRIIGTFGSETITDNNTDGVDKFTARMNKSGFYVNGSLVGTFSNIPSSLTDIGEIDIFRGKYSNSTYFAYPGSRFYSTWIDDNIFFPCRRNSDNQLGIYNTKTGEFILPSGTGSFTAGPDVTTPSPDYPMDIISNNGAVKVSLNIVKSTDIVTGAYIRAGNTSSTNPLGSETSSPTLSCTGYIKVSPSTTYTSTIPRTSNSNSAGLCYYGSNTVESVISGVSLNEQAGLTYTFTTPANCNYVRFSWYNSDGNNAQLELGSTATQYRPYGQIYTDGTQEVVTDSLGNTANAERLLAIGDYKDTQEVLSGSVSRNVDIKVLDGTENWIKSGTYTGSFYVSLQKESKLQNNSALLCTHGFGVDTLSEYSTAGVGATYWYTTNLNYKYDDGSATGEQFKQWLADQYANGTPVIIVYPTSSATTSTVTGQFISKSPVTQTAGAISGLTITTTESAHTVPTPQQPLQINCNNGVIKVSPNLFNKNVVIKDKSIDINGVEVSNTGSSISDYISVIPGQTYIRSLNGVAYGNTYFTYDKNKTFIAIYQPGSGIPFTIASGVSYIRFNIVTVNLNTYQLELGSTATTYRPYGQIYTDGTTETVEITGKNLFDISTLNDGYNFNDSGQEFPSSYGATSGYIKVAGGTTYTMSFSQNDSTTTYRLIGYNSSQTLLSTPLLAKGTVTPMGTQTYTTTMPNDCEYIRFAVEKSATNIMFEQGSTATDYEPYTLLGTATAQPLYKIGTYQDVQSVIDGGVTRNVGIKVLDGTESWAKFDVAQGALFRTKIANSVSMNKDLLGVLCNSYQIVNIENRTNGTLSGSVTNYDFLNDNYTTSDAWKAYLADQYNSGNPVVIVYPLATPTTETVTAQPLTIQEGTNIVEITQASMDNLELEVSYKAGVAVTITEVENAQLDNNVEVTING